MAVDLFLGKTSVLPDRWERRAIRYVAKTADVAMQKTWIGFLAYLPAY